MHCILNRIADSPLIRPFGPPSPSMEKDKHIALSIEGEGGHSTGEGGAGASASAPTSKEVSLFYPVFLQFVQQGAVADFQDSRCVSPVSSGLLEHPPDELLFKPFTGQLQ